MSPTRRQFLQSSLAAPLLAVGASPAVVMADAGTAPEVFTDWRTFDRATLDAAYNNSAAVPESAALFKGWVARSVAFRAQHPEHLDLTYGPRARNRFDYFSAGANTPVLVFIHGGYWQMRSKDDFAFLAEPFVSSGISVAMVGYPLGPDEVMDVIVSDARAALRHLAEALPGLGGDPKRMVLSGWSSGGHLATLALNEVPLRGGIAISGLFDLEPLLGSYLNDKLKMDVATARRNSPLLHLPAKSTSLTLFSGGAELAELRRQSGQFFAAREKAGLPTELTTVPGANHYTILNAMLEADGVIHRKIRSLLA